MKGPSRSGGLVPSFLPALLLVWPSLSSPAFSVAPAVGCTVAAPAGSNLRAAGVCQVFWRAVLGQQQQYDVSTSTRRPYSAHLPTNEPRSGRDLLRNYPHQADYDVIIAVEDVCPSVCLSVAPHKTSTANQTGGHYRTLLLLWRPPAQLVSTWTMDYTFTFTLWFHRR